MKELLLFNSSVEDDELYSSLAAWTHTPRPFNNVRPYIPRHKRSLSKTRMKSVLHDISASKLSSIHPEERGYMWKVLSGADSLKDQLSHIKYNEMSKVPPPDDTRIQRDLKRSFPNIELRDGLCNDEGISMLHRVLRTVVNATGMRYCQGMNYIACMLLMHLHEEDASMVMVRMLTREKDGYGLENLFQDKQPYLETCVVLLDNLLQSHMPDLYQHFEKTNIKATLPAIFTEWITTIFIYNLPFDAACRVWDLFFGLGQEALFLTAIAILELAKEDILACNLETFVPVLREKLRLVDPLVLTQKTLSLRLSNTLHGLEGYRAPVRWSDRFSEQCRFM